MPLSKSSRLILLAALLAFLASLGVDIARAGDDALKTKANQLFVQRSDQSLCQEAVKLYRLYLEKQPKDLEAAGNLSNLLLWMGVHQTGEPEETCYLEAAEVAKGISQQYPDRPDGHYLLGVSYALLAGLAGPFDALSYVDQSTQEMDRVLQMDPNFFYGGAYRVLGRINTLMPTLVGGDRKKAEEYLRQAIKLGPQYLANHIFLAKLLEEQGRHDEALALIKQVQQASPMPGLEPEYQFWQGLARDFLATRVAHQSKD